ncbi:hypothetical protein NE237_010333 [Protea cynaroides]|uniref:Uncharacterized protein n=1 Tax=Protea cynaroides TaxID=273540 RepID=A0A9Q0KZ40_9MAGN|nr:hypothetical protein NE237_010333 [Protea cynaroides]
MGPLSKKKTGHEKAYQPDWVITEDDTAMGDTRVAEELMRGCVLPRDQAMVHSLSSPNSIAGVDTLALGSLLKSKEQEFDLMMVENSRLRPEVERLKKSLDDEKVIRGKLRSVAEVSRICAMKYKEAFEKAKSLVVGVVRVYKKSPAFKVLVGKQSLPSFQYGVETLKEYVDERVPGIVYIEVDFLKPVKISEEPYDEDDQEIYCQLEQVFDGKVPPTSPSMSEVDSHGGSPSTPPVKISSVTGLPITPGGCINLSPYR